MHRKLVIAVGLGVSGLFLWLAFRNADLASIGSSLSRANLNWVLPFLATLFVFYWLKSMRWSTLLSVACDARPGELFPIIMIGYAGTAVLPMQLGEFVRAYIAGKRYSLQYSLVLSSIGLERIFDLLTILALLALVLGLGQTTSEALANAGYFIGVATAVCIVLIMWLVLQTESAISTCRAMLFWLPARITSKITNQLVAAAEGLASVTEPALLLRIAANSIFQWSLMGLCIWFSLVSLDVNVPISGVVLVLVATIIGISLPTSPGYLGNIQLAYVVALQPFGIETEKAIAASFFYHIIAYVSVIVVGFFFLHRTGTSLSAVRRDAQITEVTHHKQ